MASISIFLTILYYDLQDVAYDDYMTVNSLEQFKFLQIIKHFYYFMLRNAILDGEKETQEWLFMSMTYAGTRTRYQHN
jgi:hypothetical protein